MSERRPLVETLDRSTEEHFVKTGSMPNAQPEQKLKIAPEPRAESAPSPESPKTSADRRRSKRSKPVNPVGRVPVTLRFVPEIAGALKRASLERELDGLEPFTQQDIAESALEPWLREQGYLKS